MTSGIHDSAVLGALFRDAEVGALFSDESAAAAMVRVEIALARAQAAAGVIPGAAAEQITAALSDFAPDLDALASGVAASGVPTISLVAQLRERLTRDDAHGQAAASFVHWGATSQDIIDTGLVLRLRAALLILEQRIRGLIGQLADLVERHRGTVMVARTRYQPATPTTFGLKAAGWLAPLLRHLERLDGLRKRLLVVQCGGASGNLAALGTGGPAVSAALADELGLLVPLTPWHTQRDALGELAGWLSLVTGSLGKMGQDLCLLCQPEVGELSEGAGGGSSTMPQKSNPIRSETLVSLARLNAGQLGTFHQALVQEHERGGPGWQLEWSVLPSMVISAAAGLGLARALLTGLTVRPDRMRGNLDASNGLVLAEAASFALAALMPKAEAQQRVKAACAVTLASGEHLIAVLRAGIEQPLDWDALADPTGYLGSNDALIDAVLEPARAAAGG